MTKNSLAAVAAFTDRLLDNDVGETRFMITEDVLSEMSATTAGISIGSGELTLEKISPNDLELTFTGLCLVLGRSESSRRIFFSTLPSTDGAGDDIPQTQRSLRYTCYRGDGRPTELQSASGTDQRQQKASESITDIARLTQVISETAYLVDLAELAIGED